MSPNPWDDWIPGVLNERQTEILFENNCIRGKDYADIGESSFDLHISDEGYRLLRGSIKPCGTTYHEYLNGKGFTERLIPEDDGCFILKAKETYLFKIKEQLDGLRNTHIFGQATAKSSVGRVDVLARLIVDGMDGYETFRPDKLESGEMYIEITPITFDVRVKEGIALSQLRLFHGNPTTLEVSGEDYFRCMLRDTKDHDGMLSVDLQETSIGNVTASAFCAVEQAERVIDLWKKEEGGRPNPDDYWKILKADEKRLRITKDAFYILRSKEKIALPGSIAVYCRAIDETIGEMRIHYAGFVHPWFGWKRKDGGKGTPLIFEVRGHVADVNLRSGEKLARLTFYRMSEDVPEPDAISYGDQTLTLSKFFGLWPEDIQLDEEGRVERNAANL